MPNSCSAPPVGALISLSLARERARKSETWMKPGAETAERRKLQNVAVIGGGVMGAGIAQLAAFQGFDVQLKEINQNLLDAGMGRDVKA